jgi:hypothetical protein
VEQAIEMHQVLYIDLAQEKWTAVTLDESIIRKYLGGEALALYLYKSALEKQNDLSAIVLSSGYLSNSQAPCSSTLSICGKSSDTKLIDCDTNLSSVAANLKSSNWRAIVITGISRREVVIKIGYKKVEFLYSEAYLGTTIKETKRVLDLKEDEALLAIGPAGENKNPLSAVISDGLPIERKGFGALFGEKNLKAIIVEKGPIEKAPTNVGRFVKGCAKLKSLEVKSRYLKNLAITGGFDFISRANKKGFASINNNSKRCDPRLFNFSHSELKRKLGLDYSPKENCFSQLEWNLDEHTQMIDSLSLLALGPNLGNYEAENSIKWYKESIDLGLHPISVGMYIGQLMEHKNSFGQIDKVSSIIKELSLGAVNSFDNSKSTILNRYILPIDLRGCWAQSLLVGLLEDYPLVNELLLPYTKLTTEKQKSQLVVLQENLLALVRSLGLNVNFIMPLIFERRIFRFFSFKKVTLREIVLLATAMDQYDFNSKNILDVGRRAIKLKRQLNSETEFPLSIPLHFSMDPESNYSKLEVIPYGKRTTKISHFQLCFGAYPFTLFFIIIAVYSKF